MIESFVEVPIVEAWAESAELGALRLELPQPFAAEYRVPGQCVKLRNSEGDGYFAIASAPSQSGPRVDLLLKRGSKIADRALAENTRATVCAPFGKGFAVAEAEGRDVLLFAAGSGIAPIRALVQYFAAARDRFGKVALYYGQRHRGEFAYRAEHDSWRAAKIDVVLCASRESDDYDGARGYVQDFAASHDFGGVAPSHAVAYLCGPKGMITSTREILTKIGVPAERAFVNF